jgi:hypothetical protein
MQPSDVRRFLRDNCEPLCSCRNFLASRWNAGRWSGWTTSVEARPVATLIAFGHGDRLLPFNSIERSSEEY